MLHARAKGTSLVKKAYIFAKKAHDGQKRTSGEPYFTHLEAVSSLLEKELGADDETLAAALLHDSVEDTTVTYNDIKKEFGATIAKLVEGVTKVEQMESQLSKREQNMQSIRKIFRTMGKDIRVIFIKLADRLHNMQTLGFTSSEKQIRTARETQDIYCPLADLLGIRAWYLELSDICFRTLEPAAFELIRRKAELCKKSQYKRFKKWSKQFETDLKAKGWKNVSVTLLPRHYHSIYRQTKGHETLLQYIEMFYRMHIIIPDRNDCYACLGTVHQLSTPLPGNIDDYIAMPKINGYQALHSSIVTSSGNPIDVVIQTHSMEKQARYGAAIIYKQSGKKQINALPQWIETLTSLEKEEKDLHAFFTMIQSEIFGESRRIHIAGNRKQSIDVPAHSSVLDVAYYIDEEKGWRAREALVNSKSVSLKHQISDGDIVQIISDARNSPRNADDLLFLNTSLAQKLLATQLSFLPRKERIRRGKELMHRSIDIAMDPFFSTTWQKSVREKIMKDADTLDSIGSGIVNPFVYLDENTKPEDFFLLDPACFQIEAGLLPGRGMRYVQHVTLEELRRGNIIGVQTGPDVIDIVSANVLDKDRRFSKEYIPLKIQKRAMEYPFFFALRFLFLPDSNPLEVISTLQHMLDTPVKLLRFENESVTLSFHTDMLRTAQIAYEYFFEHPQVSNIFRISP